jgi:glucose/arabinose dehydrogenase
MDRGLILAIALQVVMASTLPLAGQEAALPVIDGTHQFDKRVVASNLQDPWALIWGPDGKLWVTERSAGRVVRIDPGNGAAEALTTIEGIAAPSRQTGLLGMALHPDLLRGRGRDYVYVAYTYRREKGGPDGELAAKIVAFTYRPESGALTEPTDVISGLPASDDHNSGRLVFVPDRKLYYTIGDIMQPMPARPCA